VTVGDEVNRSDDDENDEGASADFFGAQSRSQLR
jgi:hypothetical protein